MQKAREHGSGPFRVAVLHGGPGAAGSAAGLARGLGEFVSVIEPMQRADSIAGQVEELRELLATTAIRPVVLIGWSWGAMLAWIYAATHPADVSKVILVNSAVFAEAAAERIMPERLRRLSPEEQEEAAGASLSRLAELLDKADAFELIDEPPDVAEVDERIHARVWSEAASLRRSGALLDLAARITCPVVIIHGENDPHPIDGVVEPLRSRLSDVRVYSLPRCGHVPWREKFAREELFRILRDEARSRDPIC
jgi:pimeloyl-ACP methyl ester carboxylesterase